MSNLNKIYCLAGKTLHCFQDFEMYMQLCLYIEASDNSCSNEYREELYKIFNATYDGTLGVKIKKIKELHIFNEQDENVFIYLKDKRNYLAHKFFTENSFDSKEDILHRQQELQRLLHDITLICKVLKNYILYKKCGNTIQ